MSSLPLGRLICLPIKSIPFALCHRCRPLLGQLLVRNYMSSKRYCGLVKDLRLPFQTALLNLNQIRVTSFGNYIFVHNYSSSDSEKGKKTKFRSPLNKGKNRSSDEDNKKDDKDKNKNMLQDVNFSVALTGLLLFYFAYLMLSGPSQEINAGIITWHEFYHLMLATGEVEQIIVRPDSDLIVVQLHEGAIIQGRRPFKRTYLLNISDVKSFEKKLREAEETLGISPEQGVPIIYERSSDYSYLLFILGLALIVYFIMSTQVKSNIPTNIFSKLTRARFTVVDSLTGAGKGVKFADVAGLKEAKVEIMEFVDYLKAPEKFTSLGAKVPRGVLLLGPPGCGKTMLAKAVASEANVPFLAMAGTEFIEMIGGLGASRVRDLFKEARKRAPCIVYIDEIDAIGKKRSTTSVETSGEQEQTLNQLLVEMDGMASLEKVILLASTNRAEVLDKALLRPGRFDRHILIDLPTLEERKEIFVKYLKDIKLSVKPEQVSDRLASLTPGFSGADIANVCNEAALNAARYKRKSVTPPDLEYAVERVIGGIEKKSQAISPAEKKVVAYHECGHALVGWLLEHTDALLKVTIVPRTNNILGFAQYLPTEQRLFSKEQLFDRMCMALGGRVAESLIFNKVSTGAQDDLKRVTKVAYSMIKQYGMDEKIGPISFAEEEDNNAFAKKPYSKKLGSIIDHQARHIVAQAYKKTESILMENKEKLKKISEELLKHEVLNYKDIEKLIGPPPYGEKNVIQALDLSPYGGSENSETAENLDSSTKDTLNEGIKEEKTSEPPDRV